MFVIQPTFLQFWDLDGKALQNGSIYIGVASLNPETNPLTVYWDSGGTQPAAQPISTLNGTIVRDGTAANIYTNQNFSITVKNKNGVLIYTYPTSDAFVNSILGNIGFATRTTAAAATIDVSLPYLRVAGYNTVGDGGDGLYVSVADTGGLLPHQFRSNSNTRRWQYAAFGKMRPEVVGITGATDDYATLVAADSAAVSLGVDLTLSKRYNIATTYAFNSFIWFEGSGQLAPAAVTIDFLNGFFAPLHYKIFDFSSVGSGLAFKTGSMSRIMTRELYPQMFGVVADGITLVDTTMAKFRDAVKASGLEGVMPAGYYKFGNQFIWDVGSIKSTGFKLLGLGGNHNCTWDFRGAALTTNAAFVIENTTVASYDNDYAELEGFSIISAHDGAVHRLGRDDFVDPVNMPDYRKMVFQNYNKTPNCMGLLLNYVLGGHFDIQSTCSDDPNVAIPSHGFALRLRQVQFCEFFGSVGTAGVGIHMTGSQSSGNIFKGVDIENTGICVQADTSINIINNTFIGGTWNYYTNGYFDAAGKGNRIINPNVNFSGPSSTPPGTATAAGFITGNGTGIQVEHGQAGSFLPVTPAFPGWNTVFVNTTGQSITSEFFWAGGTVINSFARNGYTRLAATASVYLSFKMLPGDTAQINGSGTFPQMYFSN